MEKTVDLNVFVESVVTVIYDRFKNIILEPKDSLNKEAIERCSGVIDKKTIIDIVEKLFEEKLEEYKNKMDESKKEVQEPVVATTPQEPYEKEDFYTDVVGTGSDAVIQNQADRNAYAQTIANSGNTNVGEAYQAVTRSDPYFPTNDNLNKLAEAYQATSHAKVESTSMTLPIPTLNGDVQAPTISVSTPSEIAVITDYSKIELSTMLGEDAEKKNPENDINKQYVKTNEAKPNDGNKGAISLFSISLSLLIITGVIILAMILNVLLK